MSRSCKLVEPCGQPAVVRIGHARLSQPLDSISWKPTCAEHLALYSDPDFLAAYFGAPDSNLSVILRPLEAQTNGARP